MATKTYDPARYLVNFAGSDVLGFAEGTFISVVYNEDTYTAVTGAAGEKGRVRMHDDSAQISFTIQATSPINDVLSGLFALDKVSNSGQGALLIKDLDGTTLIAAANCWVKKQPDVEYSGGEMPTYTWILETAKLVSFVGGKTNG